MSLFRMGHGQQVQHSICAHIKILVSCWTIEIGLSLGFVHVSANPSFLLLRLSVILFVNYLGKLL